MSRQLTPSEVTEFLSKSEVGVLRAEVVRLVDELEAARAEVERLRAILPRCDLGPKACDARIAELELGTAMARRWIGTGNAIEDFDEIADWFYRDTGFMRPGKSRPLEMGEGPNYEEAQREFGEWVQRNLVRIRAALRGSGT